MKVNLIDVTKDPELMIARAGGISHKTTISSKEEARGLVRKFLDQGHYSPIEFASAMFYVDDVSRSFLAQITRHRHASFMVESQRYNEYESFDMVMPESIEEKMEEDDRLYDMISRSKESNQFIYDRLLEEGVPPEDARFFLPEGTATSMYIKANFREWMHIIDLRATDAAQWEIRAFAEKVDEILAEYAPTIFGDTTNAS